MLPPIGRIVQALITFSLIPINIQVNTEIDNRKGAQQKSAEVIDPLKALNYLTFEQLQYSIYETIIMLSLENII